MVGEVPVGGGTLGISPVEPGGNLALKHEAISDAPVEALAGEHGKLRLRHVEPAAVLGRIVPLKPLDKPPRLRCGKSFIKRCRFMRVEVGITVTATELTAPKLVRQQLDSGFRRKDEGAGKTRRPERQRGAE